MTAMNWKITIGLVPMMILVGCASIRGYMVVEQVTWSKAVAVAVDELKIPADSLRGRKVSLRMTGPYYVVNPEAKRSSESMPYDYGDQIAEKVREQIRGLGVDVVSSKESEVEIVVFVEAAGIHDVETVWPTGVPPLMAPVPFSRERTMRVKLSGYGFDKQAKKNLFAVKGSSSIEMP